jgi:hypothetical protein
MKRRGIKNMENRCDLNSARNIYDENAGIGRINAFFFSKKKAGKSIILVFRYGFPEIKNINSLFLSS